MNILKDTDGMRSVTPLEYAKLNIDYYSNGLLL